MKINQTITFQYSSFRKQFLAIPALTLMAPAIFSAPVANAAEGGAGISSLMEEITVTARKREEGLQDAPIAISAFSGDSLEARNITSLNDIQTVTPNLTFLTYSPDGASTNNANLYIRGVGQADFAPTAEPGVGLYVDGVYFGRSVGSVLDLIELERVEVLRGPQGTLFGRNTIGGALSLHTKKPHEEFEGKVEATIGTDDKTEGKFSVNVPLTDNLYSNFSLLYKRQDGYVTNQTTGKDLGDEDTTGGRFGLLWVANDNLEVNFSFDYSASDDNGQPRIFEGVVFDDGAISGTPNSTYVHNVELGVNGTSPSAGIFNLCDGTPANPAGSLNNPDCINDQFVGTNTSNGAVFSGSDTWGTALTFDWAINDSLTLKSITSYREVDAQFAYDQDFSSLPVVDRIEDVLQQEQVSQEFQLLGSTDELDWILGAYYFQEEGENPNPVSFDTVTGDPTFPFAPTDVLSGGDFDNDSKAVFAQVTAHFTDKLDVTLGLRWTEDTKRFTPDQFVTDFTTQPLIEIFRLVPLQEYEEEFSDTTPMINFSYQWTNNLMTYATYSEGFKSGGFTQRLVDFFPVLPSYEPETVDSYEVGLKYSNDDGSITVNAAAFYVDYEDIQVTVFIGVAPTLENAGTATVKGGELELKWLIADSWFFESAVGYIDAGYDDISPSNVATTPALTGSEDFARTPQWTMSASLTREIDLGDKGVLVPRVDWSYRSKTEFAPENLPGENQGAYSLWNASVAWNSADEVFGVVAGIRNLDDKDFNYDLNAQESFGVTSSLPDRGREWYLTGKYKF